MNIERNKTNGTIAGIALGACFVVAIIVFGSVIEPDQMTVTYRELGQLAVGFVFVGGLWGFIVGHLFRNK